MRRIYKTDIEICFDRLLADAENDFFPDPLSYIDFRLYKKEIVAQIIAVLKRIFQAKEIFHSNYPYSDGDVPKSNFVIRHAICMHPIDRIIYNYIVHRLIPIIEPNVSKARYSHRVEKKNYKRKYIFGKRFVKNWLDFKNDIKAFFEESEEFNYLVSTDIAGYFEYIHLVDFKKQIIDLCQKKGEKDIIDLLYKFLKNFSPSHSGISDSGIPQNYDASSYLASAFLDFLDKDFERTGYNLYRYVDDIKVACKGMKEAREVIIHIIRSLRRYNLNLSTIKTEIWHKKSPEFKDFFKEFPEILNLANKAFNEKNVAQINEYLPILVKDVKELTKGGKKNFNERLFRAYIWRIVKFYWFKELNKVNLKSIGKKCLDYMEMYPGRSDILLEFLILEKDYKYVQDGIVKIMKDCVYPWQEMHLWRLLIKASRIKNEELFELARNRVGDTNPYFEAARNYAIIFLGKHGDYQDRQNIQSFFNQSHSFFEKRCILIAIQEYSEKSQFYNRVMKGDDDMLIKSLVLYLKQRQEPEYIYEDKRIGSIETIES